jgi:hypothetical protein
MRVGRLGEAVGPSSAKNRPSRLTDQALNKTYDDDQKPMKQLFQAQGMVLTGPPLVAE